MMSGGSILIVDDEVKNLMVLWQTLNEYGYHVSVAESAQEALVILETEEIDLILLDVMMPGTDGIELCRKLKNDERTSRIPVIFLTARSQETDVLEGFKAGGSDYVTKPFSREILLARVKTHISLNRKRKQLKLLNGSLEEKVEERTRELSLLKTDLEKANEQLKTLDQAKAGFLKIVSHEIRTPLNGIIGALELLKMRNEMGRFSQLIKMLDSSVRRLEKFSRNALLSTELMTGKRKIRAEKTNIYNLLNETIQDFLPAMENKRLSVSGVDGFENITLPADPSLLKCCFSAILDNAVRFSKPGSIITVKEKTDDFFIIDFVNEGPEFPVEIMDKGFRLFGVGDRHVDQNVGLDLAISKMIMDLHEGDIRIRNTGSGAGVQLCFKLSPNNHGEKTALTGNRK